MTNSIRFGIAGGASMSSMDEVVEMARKAEGHGYSSFTANDHLHSMLSPFPVLVAAAAATSTIRLGTLVLGVDFRHPAFLAKEAATVDLLSGGRLELGIGAGWADDDYRWAGIPKERAGIRIERLSEAITICRGIWGGGTYSFKGDHFQIDGLECTPAPPQGDQIPIVVGGGGVKLLSLAARQADIIGINPSFASGQQDVTQAQTATEELTRSRIDLVRKTAGAHVDQIELQCRVHLAAVVEDNSLVDFLANATKLSVDEVRRSPHNLVGSVDEIVEKITRWAAEGLTYWVIPYEALDAMEPVIAKLNGTTV